MIHITISEIVQDEMERLAKKCKCPVDHIIPKALGLLKLAIREKEKGSDIIIFREDGTKGEILIK